MELTKRIEGTRQVGGEFLTWLMFKSVTSDGLLETSLGRVELWFEDKIKFVSPLAGGEVNILKGESPAQGTEASTALLRGKHIDEARISVSHDGKKWEFSMSGPQFSLTSLKLPAVLGESELECVLERYDLLSTLEEILRSLYHEFVSLRLDKERFEQECSNFEKWVRTESEQ